MRQWLCLCTMAVEMQTCRFRPRCTLLSMAPWLPSPVAWAAAIAMRPTEDAAEQD